MKKNFYLIPLFILASFILAITACSKDSDNDSPTVNPDYLIGEWECSNIELSDGDGHKYASQKNDYFNFGANRTYIETSDYGNENGTWSITNTTGKNKLYITSSNSSEPTVFEITELTASTLKLKPEDKISGYDAIVTYKRKSGTNPSSETISGSVTFINESKMSAYTIEFNGNKYTINKGETKVVNNVKSGTYSYVLTRADGNSSSYTRTGKGSITIKENSAWTLTFPKTGTLVLKNPNKNPFSVTLNNTFKYTVDAYSSLTLKVDEDYYEDYEKQISGYIFSATTDRKSFDVSADSTTTVNIVKSTFN